MNKYLICLTLLMSELSALAMDNHDLYLVIGSTRNDTINVGEINKKIHGVNVVCTHENTFDGNATTLDLEPCKHKKHIQADAITFDFSSYNIKNVYIERMLTSHSDTSTAHENNNLVGAIIKNFAPHMTKGAPLEIELDPCLNFFFSGITEQALAEFRTTNPFHAWINFFTTYNALLELGNTDLYSEIIRNESLKNDFHTNAMAQKLPALRERFIEKLKYISDISDIAYEDLAEIIYYEMKIYHACISPVFDSGNFKPIPLALMLADGHRLDASDYKGSLKSCRIESFDSSAVPTLLSRRPMMSYRGSFTAHEWFDANKMFVNSFSNKFISSCAVKDNRDYIVNFLESCGFSEVKIKFTDSPYNGRKNIWLISAIKN